MDIPTTYFLVSLMILANGGVLGLMHKDLPRVLQPSAVTWRIATLLLAGGCVLFAVQDSLPGGFILPIANGLVMLGYAGYWHALRKFYQQPDAYWFFLPVPFGIFAVFWFAQIQPSLLWRILIVNAICLFLLLGCFFTLIRAKQHGPTISRRVMAGIFLIAVLFTLFRSIVFGFFRVSPGLSLLDHTNWLHIATPILFAMLAVIGTTAYLLLCSQWISHQWKHAASTDYLTGLVNRRTLIDEGKKRFTEARARKHSFALAVIDIDHFKRVNDEHGHDVGDAALKFVAARLVKSCRDTELAGRQGGEEFVVLFENIDANQAHAAGERCRVSVQNESFDVNGQALTITVSIGVASLRENDTDFHDLLRRADQALYAAKASGRNRVEMA